MYKYYKPEYDIYYREVSDTEKLDEYINTLSNSVDEVVKYTDIIVGQLTELAGDSINEIDNTIANYIKEFTETKDKIVNELENISQECGNLQEDLDLLKQTEESIDYYLSGQCEYVTSEEYISSGNFAADEQTCLEQVELVEAEIKAIKEFNVELEGFSLKTLTLSLSINDSYKFDVEKLSKEERDQLIKDIIEEYEALYNNYRSTLRANQQDGMFSVLLALGYDCDQDGCSSTGIHMDGAFSFETFKRLHTYLHTPIEDYSYANGKTPLQIINDYFNGMSFEESGMYGLMRDNGIGVAGSAIIDDEGNVEYVQARSVDDFEMEFWENMMIQIDGRGDNANPPLYYLMSTDYYKECGNGEIRTIKDWLVTEIPQDPNDPNWKYYVKEYLGWEDVEEYYRADGTFVWPDKFDSTDLDKIYNKPLPNATLIQSLKKEFVKEGYLDGLNQFSCEMDQLNDEYGTDVLPLLEALDGRMDWTDNNSVIPKDVITSYINGASWEESGLSAYSSKSEEEFLTDYAKLYGKDYSCTYSRDGGSATNGDPIPKWEMAETQTETSGYDVNSASFISDIKADLRSSNIGDKIGSYYDHVNDRNNQIEDETVQMYAISKAVRTLKDDLVETSTTTTPSATDKLRAQNEAEGRKIAEGYLDVVDGISGKNEHVHKYAQDEYVAIKQAENPALTREEILKDYTDAWKQEYQKELINTRNYNPECARRMAEAQNYDNKPVVVYDDLNPLQSVEYFCRDVAADTVTLTVGVTAGSVDLARDLKHVVAPDLVPTPLQYAEDYIAEQYNDPNSKYYDPVKGTIFSVSRTVGHEAPVQVLKAIPQTKAVGEVLDVLVTYGQNVQECYEANGGNNLAAHIDGAVPLLSDAAGNAVADAAGGGYFARVFGKAVESVGNNGWQYVTGRQTGDETVRSIEEDAIKAFVKETSGDVDKSDFFWNAVSQYSSAEIDNVTDAVFHDNVEALSPINQGKNMASALFGSGKDLYNSNKAEKKYNAAVGKELDEGTIYKNKDTGQYMKKFDDGIELEVNINPYLEGHGMDSIDTDGFKYNPDLIAKTQETKND